MMTDNSFANVSVPQVGGRLWQPCRNAAVQADIDRLLDQFRRDAEVLACSGYQSLDGSYEVTADTDRWFNLLRVRQRPFKPVLRPADQGSCAIITLTRAPERWSHLFELFPSGSDYVLVLSGEVRFYEMERRRTAPTFSMNSRPSILSSPSTGSDGGLVLVFDEASVAAAVIIEFFPIPCLHRGVSAPGRAALTSGEKRRTDL